MSEALYRKYRPQVFGDLVGQDHIERTIRNALDNDQVSHAYLFCGPRGTGKTTMARLLAKALLCEKAPTSEPDGTCEECEQIASGTHPDVYELDAASRTGVENVRDEIISRVNYAPTRGNYKVYIIDEVHMLSQAAFNALLKTVEEPPDHVVFILCTTDPQKVPETIHSRCQRFEFHRLSDDEIVSRLGAICVAEGVEFEGDALELIAHRAEGGLRNALTTLEQLISFGKGNITVKAAEDLLGALGTTDIAEIMRAIGQRDVATCFTWTADYVETGADLAQFVRDMAEHVRNLYVLALAGTDAAIDIPEAERRLLSDELEWFSEERLARMLGVLGDLSSELRTSSNPRLNFEIALTRMVRPDSDLSLEALAERIEALEEGHTSVVTVVPAAPAPAVEAAPAPAPVAQSAPEPAPAPEPEPVQPAPEPQPAAPVAAQPAPAPDVPAQPAPSAPAAPAADAEGPDIAAIVGNPAALQRVWHNVTSIVKKEKVSFGVLLVGTRALAAEDGQGVVIEFPASNPLAFSIATMPEMTDCLTRAFKTATGIDVPFYCVQSSDAAAGDAPASAAPAAPAPAPEPVSAPAPDPASASAPEPAPAPAPEPEPPAVEATQESAPATPEAPSEVVQEAPGQQPPFDPDIVERPAAAETADTQPEDLGKMFSDAMGGAIVFEEVDE